MTLRAGLAAILAIAVAAPGAGAVTFDEAMEVYRAQRPDRAVSMFRELAKQGDTAAQTNLGVLEARGIGTPQSEASALYWLWRAALSGERRAAAMSSHLEARIPEAARNEVIDRLAGDLEAEARGGSVEALISLGRLEARLRQPRDPAVAYQWFALAAAFGSAVAGASREIVSEALSAPDRLEAQAQVATLFDEICRSLQDERPASCP